ncbi:Hypothetical_protein [Hexamita inflata]|uniref:Hypothetical_protein n=1 Tax=Hexamita inflata TaxID=28002 RepID=A0AA86Q284_9EUKA|nr:Hypothetical protein HINF_LOCUS31569 [Hexamita inflata]
MSVSFDIAEGYQIGLTCGLTWIATIQLQLACHIDESLEASAWSEFSDRILAFCKLHWNTTDTHRMKDYNTNNIMVSLVYDPKLRPDEILWRISRNWRRVKVSNK